MSLAQLKRDIKKGARIEIEEIWQNGVMVDIPLKMQGVGEVMEVNTTGFYILRPNTESRRGSFCEWPKAKDFERYGDVFTVCDPWGKRVYRILNK